MCPMRPVVELGSRRVSAGYEDAEVGDLTVPSPDGVTAFDFTSDGNEGEKFKIEGAVLKTNAPLTEGMETITLVGTDGAVALSEEFEFEITVFAPGVTLGATSVTAAGVTVTATPNAAGEIHVGVQPAGAAPPVNLLEVVGMADRTVSASVLGADAAQDITVSGLTADTPYALYAILSKAGGVELPGATVMHEEFRTLVTPEVTLGLVSSTAVGVTVMATANVSGEIHVGAFPLGAGPPSSLSQVMGLAARGSAVTTAGVAQDISVLGLTADTDYVLYAILSSEGGVELPGAIVTQADFRTLVAPELTLGAASSTAVGVTVSATPSVVGEIQLGAQPAGADPPTDLLQVLGLSSRGSASVIAAGMSQDITVSGLVADTAYVLYAILSELDGSELPGSMVTQVAFRTSIAPRVTLGALSVTALGVTVLANPNVAGTIHVGASSPSTDPPADLLQVLRLADTGSMSVTTVGTDHDITVLGLTSDTPYVLHAILSSSSGGALAGATVTRVAFRTSTSIAPRVTLGALSVTALGVTVLANPNVAGTIHVGASSPSTDPPTNLLQVLRLADTESTSVTTVGTDHDITVLGLTSDTPYVLHAILSSSSGGALAGATVTRVAFRTSIAPRVMLSAASATSLGVTVPATTNVPGRIHYVIVASSAAAPVDLAGLMAIDGAGFSAVTTPGTLEDIVVTGLTEGTDYVFYAIVSDAGGVELPGTTMATMPFTTALLTTPTIAFGTPLARTDGITVPATTNTAGRLHYVALPSTAAAPPDLPGLMATPGAIFASAAAETGQGIELSGLMPSTDYVLYAILSDSDETALVGGLVAALEFTTPPLIPKITLGGASATSLGVTAAATANVAGRLHYVVLASTIPAPSDLTGLMATPGADFVSVTTPGSLEDIVVSGLVASTDYVLYAILSDDSDTALEGGLMTTVTFSTAALTTPTVAFGTASVRSDGVMVPVTTNTTGRLHYVVLASAALAPTDLAGLIASPGATFAPATAETRQDIEFSGLMSSTAYVFYVILSDDDDMALEGASMAELEFTTVASAPSFTFGTASRGWDSVMVPVTSNTTGRFHYRVVLASASPPSTLAEVMVGGLHVGVTAGTASDVVVSGLMGSTRYALYGILSDNDGMALAGALVASLEFTTQGETLGPGVGEALAHVYPNPAADVLYIELPGGGTFGVSLLNIMGWPVLEERYLGGGLRVLDVSSAARGVYILVVVNEEGFSQIFRIIL